MRFVYFACAEMLRRCSEVPSRAVRTPIKTSLKQKTGLQILEVLIYRPILPMFDPLVGGKRNRDISQRVAWRAMDVAK